MKDRVIGTENEYGVMIKNEKGLIAPPRPHNITLTLDIVPEGSINASSRVWFTNGGCVYTDIGHPEYASPEARRVKDALLYNKAGEFLAAKVFPLSERKGKKYYLFKNNLAVANDRGKSESFGFHENYMVRDWDASGNTLQNHLIPFLATRHIYGGSGWWVSNDEYSISQRALIIEARVNRNTTNKRPIINTREESHARGGLNRLHLIMGDANILDFALFLKMGATSLVLSLLEAGEPFVLRCINPVRVMRESAQESVDKAPLLEFEDGNRMSVFNVQEMYLQKVKDYLARADFPSEDAEAESLLIAQYWEQALHAIATNDISWMLGRIDHVTKRWLAENEIKKKGITSEEDKFKIKKHIDIFYHGISERGLRERIEQKWADRRLVTDEEIQEAIIIPPQDTRARLRGNFVKAVEGRTDNIVINWSQLKLGDYNFNIKNPLAYRHDALEEFMMNLGR